VRLPPAGKWEGKSHEDHRKRYRLRSCRIGRICERRCAGRGQEVQTGEGVKNIGKSVGKTARKAGKEISRSARWGADAIWIGTRLGAGTAALTQNCKYYYRRYQDTRDPKWRSKYSACIRH
jgi:hypothetical protein